MAVPLFCLSPLPTKFLHSLSKNPQQNLATNGIKKRDTP